MKNYFKNFLQATKKVVDKVKLPFIFSYNFSHDPGRDMTGFKVDCNTFFDLYSKESDISSCIRELQENAGASGYELIDKRDPKKEVPEDILQEFDDILNFFSSFRDLLKLTVRNLGICDNAYWALVKNVTGTKVLGVKNMDPRTVAIVMDEHGVIYKYIQKKIGYDPVEFEPEEVIHFKRNVDPNNEMLGFSPMEQILFEGKTDISAMLSNFYFFENDAKPSSIFLMDDSFSKQTEENQQETMDKIKKQFGGVQNKGKSSILSGIKSIETVGLSQKDMDYLEGRKFTTDKISSAYGVPKFMLGYTEAVNNNNGEELTEKFYTGTIASWDLDLGTTIDRDFLCRLGLNDRYLYRFKAQSFEKMKSVEERALKEMESGALTLRQYKLKTKQEVTPEDEKNPNIDKYVIHKGVSAMLLEDVGMDDDENPEG